MHIQSCIFQWRLAPHCRSLLHTHTHTTQRGSPDLLHTQRGGLMLAGSMKADLAPRCVPTFRRHAGLSYQSWTSFTNWELQWGTITASPVLCNPVQQLCNKYFNCEAYCGDVRGDLIQLCGDFRKRDLSSCHIQKHGVQ